MVANATVKPEVAQVEDAAPSEVAEAAHDEHTPPASESGKFVPAAPLKPVVAAMEPDSEQAGNATPH